MGEQHLKAQADGDCDQHRGAAEQALARVGRPVREADVEQVEGLAHDQCVDCHRAGKFERCFAASLRLEEQEPGAEQRLQPDEADTPEH